MGDRSGYHIEEGKDRLHVDFIPRHALVPTTQNPVSSSSYYYA